MDLLSRGSSRLDSPRHQTLRAALEWSYTLLDADEQRLFVSLAVFVGGWSLKGAQALCADRAPRAVRDTLSALIDKSLVIGETDGDQRRFRLLDTVRDYALEKLAESGDLERVQSRHVEYVRVVADHGAATRLGVRYPGDVAWVRREHGNVRAALRWLLEEGRFDQGLDLCQSLAGFWLSQGLLSEGEEWMTAFLARPDRVSPHARAEGLHAWGRLAEYAGELDRAGELFEQSRATSVAAEYPTTAARALCGLGDLALHRGDHDRALSCFRSALDWAEAADSRPETAQALLCLGRAASLRGDLALSRDWLERALAIERQLADRWGVAYALNELGQIARRTGEPATARALMEECHVLWRQAGTRMGERAAVMNLTVLAVEQGGVARSAELAREALELAVWTWATPDR